MLLFLRIFEVGKNGRSASREINKDSGKKSCSDLEAEENTEGSLGRLFFLTITAHNRSTLLSIS